MILNYKAAISYGVVVGNSTCFTLQEIVGDSFVSLQQIVGCPENNSCISPRARSASEKQVSKLRLDWQMGILYLFTSLAKTPEREVNMLGLADRTACLAVLCYKYVITNWKTYSALDGKGINTLTAPSYRANKLDIPIYTKQPSKSHQELDFSTPRCISQQQFYLPFFSRPLRSLTTKPMTPICNSW